EPEVVSLARAFAHAREDGDAAVLSCDVVDQLLDEDGLAKARPAEETHLPTLDEWSDQVDHLEARLEDLDRRRELPERRRLAVNGPALDALGSLLLVDRVADDVPEPPERRLPHRNGDGQTGVEDIEAPGEPIGRIHGHRADTVVAEVLLDLSH